MRAPDSPSRPQFYFALPRLFAALSGGSAARSESNAVEAHVGSVVVFVVTYLFLATFVPIHNALLHVVALIVLAFLTWIFWLVLVYLNSVILWPLRRAGFLKTSSSARPQSVMVGFETTIFALVLAQHTDATRFVGKLWIAAVCVNMLAAIALSFMPAKGRIEA